MRTGYNTQQKPLGSTSPSFAYSINDHQRHGIY